MTDKADEVLEKIRKKAGLVRVFNTYKIRITVPFSTTVLVSATTPERALRQVQWDLMPEDREHILNNAEWKHMYANQFSDCSGPDVVEHCFGDIPALEGLLPPYKSMTAEELEELMSNIDDDLLSDGNEADE